MTTVIIVIALSGCAPAAAPTPTAPAPTAAPATAAPAATPVHKIKLKSAYSQVNPDASVAWIAKEVGFFDKNGLDVELIFIDGGTRHAQALVSGDVSIGFTSATPPVNATAGGADLVLIAGIVNRVYHDFVVLPSIKTGADLKGKKAAVSGPSGSSATAMRIALRELFKLDPDKDVVTVSIDNEVEREAALLSGQIDETVMNPELPLRAKKDGLVVLDTLWGRGIAETKAALEKGITPEQMADNSFVKALEDSGFVKANCR